MPSLTNFLLEKCTFQTFDETIIDSCTEFDCGHEDLNSFFKDDSQLYSKELLGKSYCFTLDEFPEKIVCAFTISNDSIKVGDLPNARRAKVTKRIPREKTFKSYPAVLIGRLGVAKEYQGSQVSEQLMNFIKAWFIDGHNKTGCRYIVVDSYNEPKPINYYGKNGFETLFSTEDQEKKFLKVSQESCLKTRLLYFDLIILRS